MYKLVRGAEIEAYRNTFANLALPLFAMAEPVASKTMKYNGMEWTLWDRWIMEGDLTVQELLDWCVLLSGTPIMNDVKSCKRCRKDLIDGRPRLYVSTARTPEKALTVQVGQTGLFSS
jgi:hypothetical protein